MFKRKLIAGLIIAGIFVGGCAPEKSLPEEDSATKSTSKTESDALDKLSVEQQKEYREIVRNAYKLYLWAKYPEALAEFKKAAEIAEYPEVYFNMATIYAKNKGEHSQAFANFYKVYQMDPDYNFGPEFARGFAMGLLSTGKFDDVIKWTDIAMKKWYSKGEPGIGYILRTRVYAYREIFQYDKAVELAKESLKDYPNDEILLGSMPPLIDFFDRNRDQDTDEPLIMFSKTRHELYPENKIDKFLEILEKHPKTKLKDEIYYQVGRLYGSDKNLYGLQDFEKQIEYMKKLIEECPDSPFVELAQSKIETIDFNYGRRDNPPEYQKDIWYKKHRKGPMPTKGKSDQDLPADHAPTMMH